MVETIDNILKYKLCVKESMGRYLNCQNKTYLSPIFGIATHNYNYSAIPNMTDIIQDVYPKQSRHKDINSFRIRRQRIY